MKIACIVILLMLSITPGFAATSDGLDAESFGDIENLRQAEAARTKPANTTAPTTAIEGDKLAHEFQMQKEQNKVHEVVALCVLAVISLFVVLHFLTKNKDGQTGSNIVNATGLIFIVVGTISLTIMAQTEQQLTAAIGILGAIAGYLFGSMKHREPADGKPTLQDKQS